MSISNSSRILARLNMPQQLDTDALTNSFVAIALNEIPLEESKTEDDTKSVVESITESKTGSTITVSNRTITKRTPKQTLQECDICCETMNKSNRKPVVCSCDNKACATCVKRYLLDSVQTAHCMKCRKDWDTEFLSQSLTQVFLLQEYKKHRETVLFDREKSMFPETMPYVERERQKETLREQCNEIEKSKQEVPRYREENRTMTFEQFCEQERVNVDIRIANDSKNREIEFLHFQINLLNGKVEKGERSVFIRACPFPDCLGFLSTQWKCGLCNKWTCPDCHEMIGIEKNTEHTCLPENIQTAQLLAKETRNCPKCAAGIFKISGCNMMFCTNCHTSFDWKTGKEYVNTQIHNPHYFEYLRQRQQQTDGTTEIPRTVGDLPCGGLPADQQLIKKENQLFNNYSLLPNGHRPQLHINNRGKNALPSKESITQVVLMYRHIMADIPHYAEVANTAVINRDFRIRYLMGRLSELNFKGFLQQQEKTRNKRHDILLVLQMFSQCCSDIIMRYYNTVSTKEEHYVCIKEYTELHTYIEECFRKIGKRYNCVPLRLPNWDR